MFNKQSVNSYKHIESHVFQPETHSGLLSPSPQCSVGFMMVNLHRQLDWAWNQLGRYSPLVMSVRVFPERFDQERKTLCKCG